jgi:hypothetical protein
LQLKKKKNNNDALALKTILSGLSSLIKESMEQCTSTKDLWLKLEETYQIKKEKEDIEDHSIKIIKGKESPKTLDCIISKCDLENISSEDKESSDDSTKEDLEDISNEGKNYVLMLAKRKIVKIFQMKVKNPKKPLIAMMMMIFSLQVKKKI